MIGMIECAKSDGPALRSEPSGRAASVARLNNPATTQQNSSSASEPTATGLFGSLVLNLAQASELWKLSHAVLPSSTLTTATKPGAGGVPSRLRMGLRTTRRPSAVRPNIDMLLIRVE